MDFACTTDSPWPEKSLSTPSLSSPATRDTPPHIRLAWSFSCHRSRSPSVYEATGGASPLLFVKKSFVKIFGILGERDRRDNRQVTPVICLDNLRRVVDKLRKLEFSVLRVVHSDQCRGVEEPIIVVRKLLRPLPLSDGEYPDFLTGCVGVRVRPGAFEPHVVRQRFLHNMHSVQTFPCGDR